MTDRDYKPDFAVPPGETIKKMLDQQYFFNPPEFKVWVRRLFIIAANIPNEEVLNKILGGEIAIDKQLAQNLALIFQTTTAFWLNLQAGYDETKRRIGKEKKK